MSMGKAPVSQAPFGIGCLETDPQATLRSHRTCFQYSRHHRTRRALDRVHANISASLRWPLLHRAFALVCRTKSGLSSAPGIQPLFSSPALKKHV